ncbi:signal recognition particle subunit SRP68 [Tanacetum coccineum]
MNRIRCFKTTWFVVDVALKPTTIPLSLLAEHGRYKCRVEQYLDWRWFLSNERRYALWHHHFLKDSVVFQLLKSSRMHHGLKFSDYTRYRRYCNPRLRRLYKSLKFTHGRGDYVKKSITTSTVIEVRVV